MSDRGSFVTEYIYCPECVERLMLLLGGEHPHLRLHGQQIVSQNMDSPLLPIFAGFIGGSGAGEELWQFEDEFFPYKEEDGKLVLIGTPCHPVRISVLTDSFGSIVCMLMPNGAIERLATVTSRQEQRIIFPDADRDQEEASQP